MFIVWKILKMPLINCRCIQYFIIKGIFFSRYPPSLANLKHFPTAMCVYHYIGDAEEHLSPPKRALGFLIELHTCVFHPCYVYALLNPSIPLSPRMHGCEGSSSPSSQTVRERMKRQQQLLSLSLNPAMCL